MNCPNCDEELEFINFWILDEFTPLENHSFYKCNNCGYDISCREVTKEQMAIISSYKKGIKNIIKQKTLI